MTIDPSQAMVKDSVYSDELWIFYENKKKKPILALLNKLILITWVCCILLLFYLVNYDWFIFQLLFSVPLKNKIKFTKCWKLSVRGYTKAGTSAEVSAEIRNCSQLQQVRPAIVLDAKGAAAAGEYCREKNETCSIILTL